MAAPRKCEKRPPSLASACEGGEGGAGPFKYEENLTREVEEVEIHLHTREVEDTETMAKCDSS